MGGEHLISLPVIEQVAAKYPGLKLLHFDAHADLRENYMGQPLSHASVIRHAVDWWVGRMSTNSVFAQAPGRSLPMPVRILICLWAK
ncbi:hypothetical protein N752_17400 [Desulforamulus aquiferis]|nr:hypothetical protein N752_17400 [Desulforamulus aquiferis]